VAVCALVGRGGTGRGCEEPDSARARSQRAAIFDKRSATGSCRDCVMWSQISVTSANRLAARESSVWGMATFVDFSKDWSAIFSLYSGIGLGLTWRGVGGWWRTGAVAWLLVEGDGVSSRRNCTGDD